MSQLFTIYLVSNSEDPAWLTPVHFDVKEVEETNMPSSYAFQHRYMPETTTSIVQSHLCHVYPCFCFLLPRPEIIVTHKGSATNLCPPPHPLHSFSPQNLSHPTLPPHNAQMLQHSFIGVQEPLHAILYTRLLFPVQAAR